MVRFGQIYIFGSLWSCGSAECMSENCVIKFQPFNELWWFLSAPVCSNRFKIKCPFSKFEMEPAVSFTPVMAQHMIKYSGKSRVSAILYVKVTDIMHLSIASPGVPPPPPPPRRPRGIWPLRFAWRWGSWPRGGLREWGTLTDVSLNCDLDVYRGGALWPFRLSPDGI